MTIKLDLREMIYERMGTIIPIEDIGKLEETIVNYEQLLVR